MATHGQEHDDTDFKAVVEPLGRRLVQRTTLYGRTQTEGRRLQPVDDDGLAGGYATTPVTLGCRPDDR